MKRLLFSIILLNSLALNASEYLISYRYIVKDVLLYNEKFYISKAMQKCKGTLQEPIILSNEENRPLNILLSDVDSEFIEYIHRLGLDVQHNSVTKNMQNSSTTVLTLKTTCFKVDFNDMFVKMTPLK
ncbi:MAG: hypothetical protein U9P38_07275 [Campylobacterota bacterium]|nr:hypothetical protein [Campylobacterota bacterium]